MSNLIKSRYVAFTGEDKFLVDSNERSEEFRVINFANRPQVHLINREETAAATEGFVPGLDAPVIEEEEPKISEEELRIQLEDMIAKAEEEASLIRNTAKEESRAFSKELYEQAEKKGYEEGINRGMQEALIKQKEYEELKDKLLLEYEEKIASLEPEFAEIMAKLIERVTGISVEEKKGVITHMLHKAILHGDSSKFYHIKVSKEDYEEVLAYKPKLLEIVSESIELEIAVDKNLLHNQCIIDMETGIVDCSLGTQLENLRKDIILLSDDKL